MSCQYVSILITIVFTCNTLLFFIVRGLINLEMHSLSTSIGWKSYQQHGVCHMLERLFVFGLPGSGKSTISQHIVDHVEREAQTKDWSALPINDYHILYEMFLTEKKRERFKNF